LKSSCRSCSSMLLLLFSNAALAALCRRRRLAGTPLVFAPIVANGAPGRPRATLALPSLRRLAGDDAGSNYNYI
jgi:hypothetical protein